MQEDCKGDAWALESQERLLLATELRQMTLMNTCQPQSWIHFSKNSTKVGPQDK